ncbi:MAG: ABC-type antimicrobial peptide transport system, ATPase component [Verrucomicrobiales bacterium]|nr:ABC-type antimicrobial peptide transport system, ATPase component [Verrucomicrobiales bacterium]
MSQNTAVLAHQITKGFGKENARTMALKGADFEAPLGELQLIVGPSGCGKTTLLSIIAGTLDPDEGSVTVLGENLGKLSKSRITDFRRRNIGFIFQQFNLIPTLTLVENTSVPLLLNGASRHKAEQAAQAMLDLVGLSGRGHHYPRQLSGGQQQRVAIARAMVHDPRLIICDEPTSALDRDTGHQVMELLKAVARKPGRSVIVVTHDPRVYDFADRIAEMEDGRVLNNQPAATSPALTAAHH